MVLPLFMLGNSMRNVSTSALSSRVPAPAERARFMSAQSAVQHLASALGAALSTRLLSVGPDGRLEGVRALALTSTAAALALPGLLHAVSVALTRREAARAQGAPAEAGLR